MAKISNHKFYSFLSQEKKERIIKWLAEATADTKDKSSHNHIQEYHKFDSCRPDLVRNMEENEEYDEEVATFTSLMGPIKKKEEKHRKRRIEEKKRDEQSRKDEGKKHTFLLMAVNILFEGVYYSSTHDTETDIWYVEDKTGNIVGEWIDTYNDSWIYWNHDCWEDKHKEHEDYTGEE